MTDPLAKVTDRGRLAHSSDYIAEVSPFLVPFFCLFMFVSFMERFYDKGTGSFNSLITLVYVVLFCCLIALRLKTLRFDLYDLAALFCVAYFVLHFYESRAFFYAAKAFIVYGVVKTCFKDLTWLHRALILAGLICCLLFCREVDRWTGFYNASAPVFGLTMTCSTLYLLHKPDAKVIDYVFAGIASFLVGMTQTRVLIIAVAVFWLAKFGDSFFSIIADVLRRHKVISFCLILIAAFLVFTYYEEILGLVAREGDEGSNRTRIGLMEGALAQWVSTPLSFVFGHGGGYAMAYTAMVNSFTVNVPVHQDVLMLLCDYGVIGVGLFAVLLAPSARKWPWYCWIFLAIATFHNVFTTSSASVLMFLTFQTLSLCPTDVKKGGIREHADAD